MSDMEGGVFSRPPEDEPGAEAAPDATEASAPAPRTTARKAGTARKAVKKTVPAKKAAAKKAAPVKKAAAKKAAPVKKAAVAKKAAAPAKRVSVAKKAPASRKRTPANTGATLAAPTEPVGPTGQFDASPPPPPPPTGGGFGFGFEAPIAGTVEDPTTQITSPPPPAPKTSRKDRRGARQALEQQRAGKVKPRRLPLLVAAVVLVLVAAAIAVALVIANQDEGTDYADLRVGDCVRDVSARPSAGTGPATQRRSVTEVDVVDCDVAHEAEVYAITTFPGDTDAAFPGNEQVGVFVTEFCQGPAFAQYVGKERNLSSLIDDDIQPSEVSWKAGRRQVICMASDPAGAALTGSVKGSGR